jgi:hypothetical protein
VHQIIDLASVTAQLARWWGVFCATVFRPYSLQINAAANTSMNIRAVRTGVIYTWRFFLICSTLLLRIDIFTGRKALIDEAQFKPEHTSRVNVHDPDVVEYWMKKFGCSSAELKAAVAAVGIMSSKVRSRLKAKGIGPKQ